MKFIKISIVIFMLLGLIACQDELISFEEVEKELILHFYGNEDETKVTSNITLPELKEKFYGVNLEWVSNDSAHAFINGNQVIIKRPIIEDVVVIITVNITIDSETKPYDFYITILKESKIIDIIYDVYIKDGLNETIYKVTKGKRFNEPNPSREGFNFLGYYLEEDLIKKWNEEPINESITLYVGWEEIIEEDITPPAIIGTKDIYYTIGNLIDYLFGITVTDDKDLNPILNVDDSEVDLTKPGFYPLYYIAIDSNENETIIEVNVIVEEETLDSYTETFDQITVGSSAYSYGTFIGINGIEWEYDGMRTDQILDDKALTFGKESSNYLKANINGGISKLSIDFLPVFSGSVTRNIELFLNGESITVFEVTNMVETYEVNNINIFGTVNFELKNVGGERVIVDNITIFTNQLTEDAKDIQSDIKNFNFPSNLMSETQLNLVKNGQKGSIISYKFKNPSNSNNSYFNLSSGLVTMPIDKQVSINISVTFSKGNESKTIDILLVIGEGEPMTINQAINQTGLVKTKGVLTGFINENGYIKGFIQDNTNAVEVRFNLNYLSELEVNQEYVIRGNLIKQSTTFIQDITSLTKNGYKSITTISIEGSQLEEHPSEYVYVSGLLQKNYISGAAYLATLNGVIPIVIKDIINPFIDKLLGQEVEVLGHVVYDSGIYKIWVLDAEDVNVKDFNNTLFKTYMLYDFNLDENIEINSNLTLKTFSTLFNLEIEWTSNKENILLNTGELLIPDEDNNVILTYKVLNESTLIYTGTINVSIKSGFNLSEYYKTANGKTDIALLNELTSIISKNYRSISYSATNAVLEISDKHPSGQGYLGVYDHTSITSYNKEHVWPQSSCKQYSPYRSDMHHLRISVVNTNSARSNYYFNNPTSPTSSWQVGSDRFFPGDKDKGDIARMLMYMAVRYRNDNFKLIVAESGRTSNAPLRTLGNLAVLYQWHLDDPVDNFEINRNQVIFGTQNNRNPFIDHPELFKDIWDIFMVEDQQRRLSSASIEAVIDFLYEVIAVIPVNNYMDERYYI